MDKPAQVPPAVTGFSVYGTCGYVIKVMVEERSSGCKAEHGTAVIRPQAAAASLNHVASTQCSQIKLRRVHVTRLPQTASKGRQHELESTGTATSRLVHRFYCSPCAETDHCCAPSSGSGVPSIAQNRAKTSCSDALGGPYHLQGAAYCYLHCGSQACRSSRLGCHPFTHALAGDLRLQILE